MRAIAVDEVLAKRFRIAPPPTLVARRSSRAQIAFSRMRSDRAVRGRSLAVPPEAAYSFHVPLTEPFFSDLWLGGRRQTLPPARLGDVFLFDLHENPIVALDTPFDTLRFYVPHAALDEMANEEGVPRISRLHAQPFAKRDPVMYGFAQALAGAMARPGNGYTMFCEHIALALFAHIAWIYGSLPIRLFARGGLAPWQLRRAYEFMEANLDGDPSIAQVAEQCGLSSNYFCRAFKRESGFSPHQWLMKRRISRAKALLCEPRLGLAEIAQACGFVDQSHFTRVFSRHEDCSPGRWRRLYCCEHIRK